MQTIWFYVQILVQICGMPKPSTEAYDSGPKIEEID